MIGINVGEGLFKLVMLCNMVVSVLTWKKSIFTWRTPGINVLDRTPGNHDNGIENQ